MVGSTVTFTCTASSIPRPDVTWFKIQNEMDTQLMHNIDITISEEMNTTSVRSTLQLRLVNEMDFTGYFCQGDNGFNMTDSTIAIVEPVGECLL